MRYILLRLSVNMYVSCGWFFVIVRAMRRAYSSALSMFGKPGSLSAMRRLLFGLYTPEPAMFPIPCSSGGIKEPSVYVHCWGLYFRGFTW